MRLRRGSRRSWRDARFAVLDFETTGLDFDRDHVLSYGVVPVDSGRARIQSSIYRVVHPPVPLRAESIRVHGIRSSELADAPALEDVVEELADALEGRALVAHAAGVELGFLESLRRRHPRLHVRHAVDVLDLANAVFAREPAVPRPQTLRLAAVAASFGVPVARTHHAFADALVTAQLFLVLATRLERLGAGSVRHLSRA